MTDKSSDLFHPQRLQRTPFASQALVALGVFAAPALALSVPHGYGIGFLLLCASGFLLLVKPAALRADLAGLRGIAVALLVFGLANIAMSIHEHDGWRGVDPWWPFVVAPLAIAAVARAKITPALFWGGTAVGAIAACATALLQLHRGEIVNGYMFSIEFGDAGMLLGMLCLIKAIDGSQRSKVLPLLMALGFVSGVMTSILSQERGGWIALPPALVWIIWRNRQRFQRRSIMALASLVLALLAATALIPGNPFIGRIHAASQEYAQHHAVGQRDATAIGTRLVMWNIAFDQFTAHPVLGVGKKGWIEAKQQLLDQGKIDPSLMTFDHAHNEILDTAMKRGLVGLGALLVFYAAPCVWFLRRERAAEAGEQRSLVTAGVLIQGMLFVFGLTQTYLSHTAGRMTVLGLLICVAGLALHLRHQTCTTSKLSGEYAQ